MAIGSIVPVIAAASTAHRASIVRHLARRDATSATAAVFFVPDSPGERLALATLISKRIVVEAGTSRYYVDESKVGELQNRRLRVLRRAALAALAMGAVAVGLSVLR
jgi:hypothetical protein